MFDCPTRQRDEFGEAISRTALTSFSLEGRPIPLVGPSGIWKPAACELPISITTTVGGLYDDSFDRQAGTLRYAYRGTDPGHRDNRGLRRAHGASRAVDARSSTSTRSNPGRDRRSAPPPPLRERVLRAYAERCALCRLRHLELLDAAHITPDSDAEGEPIVSNGVALCKLHHAAFDRFFFAIRPDYVIEVRPSVLLESDGPMLVVGLQQIHGQLIHLPRRTVDLPDRVRLERRYEQFRQAAG